MSTCVVSINGRKTVVDMMGAATPEEANRRLAEAGVSEAVVVVTLEQATEARRRAEEEIAERRRSEAAWHKRRDGLLAKLDAVASGGKLELSAEEVAMLRRWIEPDYSDE